MMNPGRHHIVTRALRRRLDHHGRFDFQKAVFVVVFPRDTCDFVAHSDIALQFRTAQIDITVAQSGIVIDLLSASNLKRRGLRGRQHLERGHEHFNLTCWQIGVDRPLASLAHNTVCTEHKLAPDTECLIEHFLVALAVKCQLYNPGAVAQINENKCAQIALTLRPSHDTDWLADIRLGQCTAIMCALVLGT